MNLEYHAADWHVAYVVRTNIAVGVILESAPTRNGVKTENVPLREILNIATNASRYAEKDY